MDKSPSPKPTTNYFWGHHWPNGQQRPNISKIVNFHLTWNLNRIFRSSHWIQPPIIFDVNIGQKVNIGRISKTVTFHLIHLKFEQHIYVFSLNSTTTTFKVNRGRISKIFSFHPNDLKFEDFHKNDHHVQCGLTAILDLKESLWKFS